VTTFCPPSDNSTMAPSRSAWWAVSDADDWGPHAPGYVSQQDLLSYVHRQLVQLMNLSHDWDDDGGLPVAAKPAQLSMEILTGLVVADNLATPQISPQGHGGVNIEWLVSGNHLSVSASEEGQLVMWGIRPDGSEVFSFDSAEDLVEPEVVALIMKQAREFLREISLGVRNRISIR
jgi:hypothetical protein